MKAKSKRRDRSVIKVIVFVILGVLLCFFCGVFVGQAFTPSSDLPGGGMKIRDRKSLRGLNEGPVSPVTKEKVREDVSEVPFSPSVKANVPPSIQDNIQLSLPKPGSSLRFDAFNYGTLPASIDSEDVMISGDILLHSLHT